MTAGPSSREEAGFGFSRVELEMWGARVRLVPVLRLVLWHTLLL